MHIISFRNQSLKSIKKIFGLSPSGSSSTELMRQTPRQRSESETRAGPSVASWPLVYLITVVHALLPCLAPPPALVGDQGLWTPVLPAHNVTCFLNPATFSASSFVKAFAVVAITPLIKKNLLLISWWILADLWGCCILVDS